MKRSGFSKPTLEQVIEKQAIKRAKKLTSLKENNQNGTKPRVTPKKRLEGQITTKKRKEKTQAQLKKELDTVFSLYVRQIYPKVCYTCNKPAERLQCGHYISRQYLVTRWSIDNCRPQCWGCNGYGKGQPLIFEEKLKAEYGNDFVENMKASRHQMLKLDRNWYNEQILKYKQLLQ